MMVGFDWVDVVASDNCDIKFKIYLSNEKIMNIFKFLAKNLVIQRSKITD
jgi:hypothetical protein